MTTGGEGGMVTTKDEALWRSMWSYKDHGKSYEAVFERKHPPGFRWVHESFGTNWRMLEVQAAIGRIQLRRMVMWNDLRAKNARQISSTCNEFIALRVPAFGCSPKSCGAGCAKRSGCLHAHYKCYVYVRPADLAPSWSRDRIVEAINVQGVPCYQGSCSEVYLEKAFDATGWPPPVRLPIARDLGETSLMFLVHPTLTIDEVNKTCAAIRFVLAQATLNEAVAAPNEMRLAGVVEG